jgi:general L-amino acid transport system permease protein
MTVATAGTSPSGGASLLRDPKSRAVIIQVLVVVSLVAFLWFIVHNTAINLEKRGIATGFEFLSQPAGFDIATSVIAYDATMTRGRVFLVGLLNTILVSALGIVFATVLGFTLGVLRLSPNWLINRLAYVYIEIVRNIPLPEDTTDNLGA